MSRQSTVGQQRTLSLTEELEKLEQSITLTLQEIDHNFSRAHRIVTSSILPIVEQYGNHSRDVWEGSKFWKQFFESSANVSLSGYEEQASALEREDETITDDSNAETHTTLESSHSYDTPSAQHISTDSIQDIDLSDMTISPAHSTPRPNAKNATSKDSHTATFADYPSSYEELKREVNNSSNPVAFQTMPAPETPGKSSVAAKQATAIAMTPESSPFLPPQPMSIPRPSTSRKKTDPLLHRILDRNYRVQATPLTTNRHTNVPPKGTNHSVQQSPIAANSTRSQALLADDSILSSPEPAAPNLNAEIFSSPQRKPVRTPGVSVLTPAARGKSAGGPTTKSARTPTAAPGIWDDTDDDFEDELDAFGQSPPKTMQFHVPQRRLLKTPAKEASKRIVQDLLLNAGVGRENDEGDFDEDFTDDVDLDRMGLEDDSPSVVQRARGFEDETF